MWPFDLVKKRQREHKASTKAPKVRVSIVYLLTGVEYAAQLNRSFPLLQKNWLAQLRPSPDVTIFYTAAQAAERAQEVPSVRARATMVAIHEERPAYALDVLARGQCLCCCNNRAKKQKAAPRWRGGQYAPDYCFMNRFRTLLMYKHPALAAYDYFVQLDTDTYILRPMPYDPAVRMRKAGAVWGYLQLELRPTPADDCNAGMYEAIDAYIAQNATAPPVYRPPRGTTYQGAFNIGDLRFLRSDAALDAFLQWINGAEARGIWTHRWGDQAFLPHAIGLSRPASAAMRFSDLEDAKVILHSSEGLGKKRGKLLDKKPSSKPSSKSSKPSSKPSTKPSTKLSSKGVVNTQASGAQQRGGSQESLGGRRRVTGVQASGKEPPSSRFLLVRPPQVRKSPFAYYADFWGALAARHHAMICRFDKSATTSQCDVTATARRDGPFDAAVFVVPHEYSTNVDKASGLNATLRRVVRAAAEPAVGRTRRAVLVCLNKMYVGLEEKVALVAAARAALMPLGVPLVAITWSPVVARRHPAWLHFVPFAFGGTAAQRSLHPWPAPLASRPLGVYFSGDLTEWKYPMRRPVLRALNRSAAEGDLKLYHRSVYSKDSSNATGVAPTKLSRAAGAANASAYWALLGGSKMVLNTVGFPSAGARGAAATPLDLIGTRYFESMTAGALLLCERSDALTPLGLVENRTAAMFSTADEAVALARHFASAAGAAHAQRMADRARRLLFERHLYYHRAAQVTRALEVALGM